MNIENIIPSGNGGINGEGRTLKEICEKPVPEHLINKLDDERLAPEVVNRMKTDLARMGSSRVPEPAQNGHVDFSAIAWPGVSARLPEKDGLIAAIRQNYPDISLDDINKSAEIISEKISPDANVIFGTVIDEDLGDNVVVTVVATGVNEKKKEEKK